MNAIEAERLSKYYRVYNQPIDRLKEAIRRRPYHHVVESLKNVSFKVAFGETLGIIGENGAGKSTLLKILAGTTHPTSGKLLRHGRIAALLELGSGFNPEFSGRTNIHLNAALLGLTEKEIRAREHAIISFSELEDVIDRPVKTYSSGMHVRLAFSIATSVDPDVLIVDEALSVGDQRFSQKCVERMMGFRQAGKTIIVCSHSMILINELCEKCIWLDHGCVRAAGKTSSVISEYLAFLEEKEHRKAEGLTKQQDESTANLPEVIVEDIRFEKTDTGEEIAFIRLFDAVTVRVRTRCTKGDFTGHIGIGLERNDGQMIFATITKSQGLSAVHFSGSQDICLILPRFPLMKGSFRAKVLIADENLMRLVYEKLSDPLIIESEHPEYGMLWMEHEWRF
uniref:ABC transporter ATP-binding protein n=1 Tax=Desulfatirhabdium butyrativorans TaxID=340467 RepID=A0A7C4W798_9BACT